MNCRNCNKRIDTSKMYSILTMEVGDRIDKNIPQLKLDDWDRLEDEKGKPLCNKCAGILEKAYKDCLDSKEIINNFMDFLK